MTTDPEPHRENTEFDTRNYDCGPFRPRPGYFVVEIKKELIGEARAFAFRALKEKARLLDKMGILVMDINGKKHHFPAEGEIERNTKAVGFIFDLPTARSRRDFEKVMGLTKEALRLDEKLGPPSSEEALGI